MARLATALMILPTDQAQAWSLSPLLADAYTCIQWSYQNDINELICFGERQTTLWTKQEGWSVSHGRSSMSMLTCWLQSWLMWWMTVIHYRIDSRVSWFLDLAACICLLLWLADIFPLLFYRQSESTMQTFRGAKFPLMCNWLFYNLLCVLSVSFHFVHNVHLYGVITFHLTWLAYLGSQKGLYF